MSGTRTPLELRLERLKYASNLRLDFIKRLYDRRPVAEQYLKGDVDLHLHFLSGRGMFCARYFAGDVQETQSVGGPEKADRETSLMKYEVPVFVRVGKVAQEASPVASVVRLKPLDCCNMSGDEAIEPTLLFPPLEALALIFNWKLGTLRDLSRIENSKLINKVVEGRTKIVTNFSGQDADMGRELHIPMDEELRFAKLCGITIPFPRNGIFLFLPEGFDPCYKVIQVFVCPNRAGDSAI